jgi:hypothetical protein
MTVQLPEKLSYDSLGGEKSDYSAIVDSSTDRSAVEVNAAYAAVAMMSRTAPRALVRMTVSTSDPVIASWESVWKAGTATAPTLVRSGAGVYSITFPSSVLDEQGNSHSLNFFGAQVSSEDFTTAWLLAAYATSANSITVYVKNTSGVAADPSSIVLFTTIY